MSGLTPEEKALANKLNQQFPRTGSVSPEIEFSQLSVDRQVDDLMSSAQNTRSFYQSRLMVPSEAELKYRASLAPGEALSGVAQNSEYRPTSTERLASASRPSSGSLSPTPKTTGAGAKGLMTDPPATGTPRISTNISNPAPDARPSSLPMAELAPVERLAQQGGTASLAGAGLDFAFRLINGQPVQQAATGAVGTGIGTGFGTVVGTATFGPIGGFVGGAIGGWIGGRVADFIYEQVAPRSAESVPIDVKAAPIPFKGGQGDGVQYGAVVCINGGQPNNDCRQLLRPVWGPIGGVKLYAYPDNLGVEIQVLARAAGSKSDYDNAPSGQQWYGSGSLPSNNAKACSIRSIDFFRWDGKADTDGDLPLQTVFIDARTINTINHPGNQEYAIPSATPGAGKKPAPNDYAIGGLKDRENGTPRGDSPNWVAHGEPAGSTVSDNMPGLKVSPLPVVQPTPTTVQPIQLTPSSTPTTDKSEQSFPIITARSYAPGTAQTTPSTGYIGEWSGSATTPASNPFSSSTPTISNLPTTARPNTPPDNQKSVPTATNSTTTSNTNTDNDKKIDNLTNKITQIGIELAAVTIILKGLQNPNGNTGNGTTNITKDDLENAAATGTCRTLQPGGCMAPTADNAKSAADNAAANNAILKGVDWTILGKIYTNTETTLNRVGPQLEGGLSGSMTRLSKFLGIDRILNLINFMANVHNALMLSSGLKTTLLEMLSNVGNATGLLEGPEGDSVDLNKLYDQGIEAFMTMIMGNENWAEMKLTWRKYNRIYQAGANVINSVQSMMSSLGNVVETTAEYTGKIGNALKAAGAVGEKAYQWFAEKQNAKLSKFLQYSTTVAGVTAVLSVINEVAESVIEGQQAKDEAEKQVEAFKKELREAEKNPGIENKAIADEVAKQKQNATKDPTDETEKGLLSFLTNK